MGRFDRVNGSDTETGRGHLLVPNPSPTADLIAESGAC
jgi:hypothetical protein